MTLPNSISDGQSVQAIDENSVYLAEQGFGVISGCQVNIQTGNLGAGEAALSVDSGNLLVGGTPTSTTSSDVSLDESDTEARKDVVVYDPNTPEFKAIAGTPEVIHPSGTTRQSAEEPSPVSLSSAVDDLSGSSDSLIPLAEIWVPSGSTGVTDQDIADRRIPVSHITNSVEMAEKAGIPTYSGTSAPPAGTVYFNTNSGSLEYKDDSGTVHSAEDADTLDGYDSTEFAVLAENETVDGTWTHTAEQVFDGGINGTLTNGSSLTDITGGNIFINSGELTASNMRTDVFDDGTEVVSNTTSLDFGSNLVVTDPGDGSAQIDTEGTKTTLYMSNYGTPNDGSTDDSAFDSAVSDANPGDTIVFDGGTYILNTSHTINKTLTISATQNSHVSCTNTTNNNPHIHFQGGGIQNNTTTDAAASQGDRTISVTDTSIFSAGDRVLFMESQHSAQVDTKIQFDIIESVDSTNGNINLSGNLYREFASGSYVYQVNLLDSPRLKNIETSGGGYRHFQFQWCEEPRFEDVSVSEYLEVSLYALECWKPIYQDVQATDPEGLASGEGEPIALYRTTDGYIEAPRVYDCRRGIDFAWGAHTHTIVDPVIRGVSLNGISVHQDNQSGSILITGGEIACDPNGQSGNGITGSSTAKIYIDGIRIVARENGVICNGQTHMTNVTVTPVEGITSPQLTGFNIKYGDTTIRDSYIDDPDGLFDFPVWVDGSGSSNTKHIVIDVECTHRGSNHVYLDARSGGIQHIRIRGFYRNLGGTSDRCVFIRADQSSTVDNVDISIQATQFPNQGIRLLSGGTDQVSNIRIHDSFFDTGAAAVFSDGTGSFGPIQVNNNTLNTGSTSLSFNESGVGKLIIVNNVLNGTIDSSGAGSKTISGNL